MKHAVESVIHAALIDCNIYAPAVIPYSRAPKGLGDYATNIALSLAKQNKISPIDLAHKITQALVKQPGVISAEVAGPGFINITLEDDWFTEQLYAPHHPHPILKDKKYIIEYSSPNIAKPMHVGHLRTTILGQALVNLFRRAGAQVVAWSHPGDWGVQFGKLIVGWQKWGDEAELSKHPIDELLRVYVKYHQEAKEQPELDEQAKKVFKALQEGNTEYKKLWERFTALSLEEFDRMYVDLGVVFDVWRGESSYNEYLRPLVQKALDRGVAKVSDGAVIVSLDQSGLPPALIQKTDGATLYATSDLVSLEKRTREVKPDELIYVVGNEQTLHLQQVFATAHLLQEAGVYGSDFELPKLTHVSYGFFRLTTGKMSTRKGEVIRLDDVLREAVMQAKEVLDEKSKDLTSDERAQLAKTIGIAAVKYTDLMHDRHTDVVFDWQKMFALEGNSIVYLFYTYARCNSLLRNDVTSSETKTNDGNEEALTDHEKAVIMQMLELESALEKSISEYDPHHLIDHTYTLASAFSRFYNTDPILRSHGKVKARRLLMVKRVKEQLELLFEVLGISAPERL